MRRFLTAGARAGRAMAGAVEAMTAGTAGGGAPPPPASSSGCSSQGFDRSVDALNRLPRPLLALAALGFFLHAMIEPEGFGLRMQALALVPEPMWWLLGGVVSFYFCAREAHYLRCRGHGPAEAGAPLRTGAGAGAGAGAPYAGVRPVAGQGAGQGAGAGAAVDAAGPPRAAVATPQPRAGDSGRGGKAI